MSRWGDDPTVELHVQGAVNLSNLDASDLGNEQIVIEAARRARSLLRWARHARSGISLSEIDTSTGELTKWSLMQRTTTNGDDLSITYGSDRLPNNNARYFVIKSDGDVGIGVENPNSHLHVKAIGTTPFEPPNTLRITSEFPSTTGNTIEFMDLNGNEIHAVQDNVFSTLALQPDGGDVGIGLTNASARLHVRNGAAGFYSSDLAFEDAIIEDDAMRGWGCTAMTWATWPRASRWPRRHPTPPAPIRCTSGASMPARRTTSATWSSPTARCQPDGHERCSRLTGTAPRR
jgi:hypothetical protein